MQFFGMKVESVRVLIEGLVTERESVEAEVGRVCCELGALIEDGEVDRMMDRGDECRRMVEGVVNGAVKAWDGQEGRYEREKAKHREGLLRLCAGDEE